MRKFLFYFLSFTWGLPVTLIGCIVAMTLLLTRHCSEKYGYCWHFIVGKNWGGINLGIIIITDDTPSTSIKNHEHGHGLQNTIWGVLMPFVICIPSVIRYWIFVIRERRGKLLPPYDSIWFEHDATVRGTKFIEELNKENDIYGNN